jgi:DNA-binding response OmpR family regulator
MNEARERPQQEEVLRVVLLEDDERLGRLTSKYLESHGVLVTWAQDGKSGLAEVLRNRPDAVLLDLQLPGMDGISVCRELRAKTDVPILIITARDEEADRVLGLELGADDYVAKPFSSRELLARVRAQVRRARGRVVHPASRSRSVSSPWIRHR